ncbi:MAG: LytR/AlgR family response regulator transcription factor [Streptosporangiaceae bacterium]
MPVRCLIVDDSHEFLRAARELLERDGISVIGVASTGAQAHTMCRALRPDVALIDVDLGEETGFDVARKLADRAGPQHPLIIFISAYAEDDFVDMISASPAIAFLTKAELSGAMIRAVLARAGC